MTASRSEDERRAETAQRSDQLRARIVDEAHAKQLPALIAEWADADDERRWLARALRIDLALLTERPELVLPCLYRRCAFAGGDEERGFYTERDEPPDLAGLRALVRAWAAHAPRPWLRALRPPTVPIDGAVIEEYRTGVRGTLWISDDGERLGVEGADARVAWDRGTGRRLDGARARATPRAKPAPWQQAHRESAWGRCVVTRDDARIDLELGSEQYVSDTQTLTDELVLLTGYEDDYRYCYWLLDTRTARIRWQRSGKLSSCELLGDARIVIGDADGIETIDLATGGTVSRWRCPFVGEVIVLPDGNVASRVGQVIRVWNVAEANLRSQVVHASTNSWTQAAFSPDGQRLVTGHLLCDATTGAFIAAIDGNGPDGWLEGGPPRPCQRLANDVFVEIMPFGLTLWNTYDGKQLLHDRERRGRISDRAAFDPTGRYHALWSERGSLQVYRLVHGTLVAELEQPRSQEAERTLGFSADGELLAWHDGDTWWGVDLPTPAIPRRIDHDPTEPDPATVTSTDGLLVAGDAAIPYDDGVAVVSPDGRQFAFVQSHYTLA